MTKTSRQRQPVGNPRTFPAENSQVKHTKVNASDFKPFINVYYFINETMMLINTLFRQQNCPKGTNILALVVESLNSPLFLDISDAERKIYSCLNIFVERKREANYKMAVETATN